MSPEGADTLPRQPPGAGDPMRARSGDSEPPPIGRRATPNAIIATEVRRHAGGDWVAPGGGAGSTANLRLAIAARVAARLHPAHDWLGHANIVDVQFSRTAGANTCGWPCG